MCFLMYHEYSKYFHTNTANSYGKHNRNRIVIKILQSFYIPANIDIQIYTSVSDEDSRRTSD